MPRTSQARRPSSRSTLAASRGGARPIDFQARDQRDANPLELGLVQLPTRPVSIYTQGMRKEAIDACDGGRLGPAADLTLAAITESAYCRGILADLVQGLWGLPRHWTGRADMIAELDDTPERVGQFTEMFPQPDAIRLMSWGIILGVAPGQMRRKYNARPSYDYPVSPEEASDWRTTRKAIGSSLMRPVGAPDTRILRSWSPKHLRYQWWDDAWWLLTADGEIRIAPLDDAPNLDEYGRATKARTGNPDEWLLYTPFGKDRPWEWGAWKSATQAFIGERDAAFDRWRHAEVLAPMRVGEVPAGTTETQRRKYMRQIREMRRMGILILPPGLAYKLVESTGRVTGVYKDIIDAAHREYAMITGALTTAEGARVYSKGGDVQERYARSILSSFGNSLADCFHEGGIVPWARDNYGSEDAPRPGWDAAAPEDKKTRAETLKVAGDAFKTITESLAQLGRKPTDAAVEKYWQGLGLQTEAIPARTPHPRIEITPSARENAYTLDEIRAGDGWPGLGDDRGALLVAEAEQLAKQKAAETPPPSDDAPDALPASDAPTDESASALAAKMTTYAVERCGHERPNRCLLCGVERDRDFDIDPITNAVRWGVKWRPIERGVSAPVSPLDGAAHPAAWAPGGDA